MLQNYNSTKTIEQIEFLRKNLVHMVERHSFDFQHQEVQALSNKLDLLINSYMQQKRSGEKC